VRDGPAELWRKIVQLVDLRYHTMTCQKEGNRHEYHKFISSLPVI